jgi:response regulator RpfG family c-di-GMP phosphodiesterase
MNIIIKQTIIPIITILQTIILYLIILKNRKLKTENKHLDQIENVIVFMLAYQTELKSSEVRKHLERTTKYVRLLAINLQKLPKYKDYITSQYIEDIVKASVLHDIGKVGIPDNILHKERKLTTEEFDIIKKHCEYGANTLKMAHDKLKFKSFFDIAIQIVMTHHEHWDGSGYPQGLSKDEIPLSGRIVALADVYDAIRSQRCYKKSMTHDKAYKIILEAKAKQFDPDIVNIFLKVNEEFRNIFDNNV